MRKIVTCYLLYCLVGVVVIFGIYRARKDMRDMYCRWFGLDGSSTVYQFHTATKATRLYWLMNVCNNGECLTAKDWACGYTNGNQDAVTNCFNDMVGEAKAWEKLDVLRKSCGQRHKAWTGTDANPTRCRELGGMFPPVSSAAR